MLYTMNKGDIMTRKHWFTTFAALAVTLGVCRIASANMVSPYVYFWPGFISFSIAFAFPASVLAAFIERPFLTAAGVKRRTLVFSMRANFLSTIAGILIVPIGYHVFFAIGPIWSVMAVGASCFIEISYLRGFSRQSCTLGWAVAGNIVSSVVLIAIPHLAVEIRDNYRHLARALAEQEAWLGWAALGVSIALFLASFAWRVKIAPTNPDIPASARPDEDAENTQIDLEPETDV
jgi:hypothetical protein